VLIDDHVYCDVCNGHIGRLHNLPAPQTDLLLDMRLPPFSTACPDCWDNSEVVALIELAA